MHVPSVSGFYVAQVLFFIVQCGITCFLCTLCTLCMYCHLGIVLTPRLPLYQISFVMPSIAELARDLSPSRY